MFLDGLNIPSGIAVGHGGVWVANSPDILFVQDTDGDGRADKQEVVVTRKNGESVVVVSLETWNAVNETLHLLSTPHNAARLRTSIAQLEAGKGEERELIK